MSTYYVVDLYDFSKYKDPEARAAKYLRDITHQSNRLSYKSGYIDDVYHFIYVEKDWYYSKICRATAEMLEDRRMWGYELIFLSPTKRRRLL